MQDENTSDARSLVARSTNPIVNLIDNQTQWESSVWSDSMFRPWNMDDLYQKTSDYSIYEEMLKDDQIEVCMNIKKDLILGSGWHIKSQHEDDEDVRRCIEQCFNTHFDGCFEDALHEILSAYEFGFSVTEKTFKIVDGMLALKSLKTRHPVSWLFHQDKFGDVVRYEQQGTSFTNVNPNAIIHFINQPKFGNPYGRSDLRSAYSAYFIKKQIIRYYAIFLEKAASPIPHASYKKNAKAEDVQNIFNALKKFQTSTALVYPEDFDVSFLEAASKGEVFINGITLFNMFIGRALFLPDLLGFQGSPTTGGSQALGREQMVVFFKHIMRRRKSIERLVNQHFIKPIVMWNYGYDDHCPKFVLNPITEETAIENARLWLEAIKGANYKPTNEEINHFRSIINFPESEASSAMEDDDDELEDLQDKILINHKIEQENKIEDTLSTDKDKYALDLASLKGNYHKKVDFKAIENQMNATESDIMGRLKPVMNEILDKFIEQIKAKKINDVKKLSKLENLSLSANGLGKMQKVLNMELQRAFNLAQERAAGEIQKSNFAIIPAEEFLEVLDAENFNFIRDWEYNLTKGARIAAVKAIKDGLPISSVIDFVTTETTAQALTSLERYSRTKITEVMNKGRLEFFEATKAVAGYQYSAILDDRTSDICAGLHGKIFKAGTEPMAPLHFNCRSVLVPITIYEEFEPDTSAGGTNIKDFIDDNIGKGFAVK